MITTKQQYNDWLDTETTEDSVCSDNFIETEAERWLAKEDNDSAQDEYETALKREAVEDAIQDLYSAFLKASTDKAFTLNDIGAVLYHYEHTHILH